MILLSIKRDPRGNPPSLASTAVALGEKGGSRGGTPLGEAAK
jgi:hypothetical protein